MIRTTWIEDAMYARLASKELGQRCGVGVRPRHSEFERVHPTLGKPAIERATVQSPGHDGVADRCDEFRRAAYRSKRHVAMTREHLRDAVEDHVRTQ